MIALVVVVAALFYVSAGARRFRRHPEAAPRLMAAVARPWPNFPILAGMVLLWPLFLRAPRGTVRP